MTGILKAAFAGLGVILTLGLLAADSAGAHGRLVPADLTVPFLANDGQVDARVDFYARTFGGTVFVTRDGEIVYALTGGEDHAARGLALAETPVGGTPARARGAKESVTRVSCLRGGDPGARLHAVPAFDELTLGEVWPGVELKLAAHGESVEKLFRVRPGADVAAIRLRVSGVRNLEMDPSGRLAFATDLGTIALTAPLAWQEHAGRRRPVEIAYVIDGCEYGFRVGEFDPQADLFIDPLLASTFLGGGATEDIFCLATDDAGHVYAAGVTNSSDFPYMLGAYEYTNLKDAFVAKFDADLTTLIASTFLGGTERDEAHALAIDDAGNVYVTGNCMSDDFPTTTGSCQPDFGGGPANTPYKSGGDAFVCRLTADLGTLLASTYLGGSGPEWCRGLAIDAAGDVLVAGFTRSVDFPCVAGYDSTYHSGGFTGMNSFVSELTADLSSLTHSTYLGGSGDDYIENLALDAAGGVFVAGWIASSDFPTSPVAFDTIFGGGTYDAFVTKFDNDLTLLLASTYLGGSEWDFVYGLDVDAAGNPYVTGHTASRSDYPLGPAAYDSTYNGIGAAGLSDDVFVSKLDGANLSTLLASTYLGGTVWENGWGVDVDDVRACVFVTGSTSSSGFPTHSGTFDSTWGGGSTHYGDVFVAKFDLGLSDLLAATFLGDANDDQAEFVLVDTDGNVYVSGITESGAFPTTPNAYSVNPFGAEDGFITRLDATLSGGPVTGAESLPLPDAGNDLLGMFPNPFRERAEIRFSLPASTQARLCVYNIAGECVALLAERRLAAGVHHVAWGGRDASGRALPAGVYLLRLEAGTLTATRKITLLR
jgi:hypothetical protein